MMVVIPTTASCRGRMIRSVNCVVAGWVGGGVGGLLGGRAGVNVCMWCVMLQWGIQASDSYLGKGGGAAVSKPRRQRVSGGRFRRVRRVAAAVVAAPSPFVTHGCCGGYHIHMPPPSSIHTNPSTHRTHSPPPPPFSSS